jgi:hypothetical protein
MFIYNQNMLMFTQQVMLPAILIGTLEKEIELSIIMRLFIKVRLQL